MGTVEAKVDAKSIMMITLRLYNVKLDNTNLF